MFSHKIRVILHTGTSLVTGTGLCVCYMHIAQPSRSPSIIILGLRLPPTLTILFDAPCVSLKQCELFIVSNSFYVVWFNLQLYKNRGVVGYMTAVLADEEAESRLG